MSNKFVEKGVFDDTYKKFRVKIFNNMRGIYNKGYETSDEFKELRNNGERSTALYNYMIMELKRPDTIVSSSGLTTMATVWGSGTNEEIKRKVDTHPDLGIIFNIPLYLTNTERNRSNMRRRIEEVKEEIKKQEDERKILKDEENKSIREQQEYEKKEEEERLERIRVLEEKSKLKRAATTAKMLATRARNKKEKEDEKIKEEEQAQETIKPQLSEEGKKKARIRVGEAKKEEQLKLEVDLGREQGLKELGELVNEELVKEEREKVLKAERERVGIGVDEKKEKKETEEKGIVRKPGETNREYKKRYVEYINTLPTGVNPAQFRGLERRPRESSSAYTERYLKYINKLMSDISPEMSASEQKRQLEDNYESLDHKDPSNDELYEMFSNYGISSTLTNVLGLFGPASIALDKAGSLPLYISHNLIRKGYNNIVNFLWRKDKIKDEDIDLNSNENKDINKEIEKLNEKYIKKDEEEDKKRESEIERKNNIIRNALRLGEAGIAGTVLERVTRPSDPNAVIGEDPIITTKPVTSIIDKKIDNRPSAITRDSTESRKIGARSEGGRRKYSPQIIYPDDEILEPTDRQLSRNEYNLAKFDFINPDNVGGNNSDGDNPLYKANDDELAIRYYDWKNMVIEKENEFVKQLPPKVSNKIKMQFRRSFVEPAEPIQTRLNYMIHDDTQFAPFNSPYSAMTENTGTNPFIQNSVLFGSVP